jgi:hypothetical protein
MTRPGWPCCALVAGLLGAAGCCCFDRPSCGPANASASGYPAYDPYRRSALLPPHPLAPCQTTPVLGAPPPATVNVLPGGGPVPVPSVPPGPTAAPSGNPPPDLGPQVRLSPPETAAPPIATVPPQPGVAEDRSGTPALPVGIPQFAMAKKTVATGLRPTLDGLDWLASNNYRTALHLRAPGQDDSADRKQFEQRRLTYVSLEVAPQTLSRELVDHFNHLVTDAGTQPLFVYDKDGTLAGPLWYLHFRTAEGASDEDARARARRLGLREDAEEAKPMWLAVQQYLSGLNK